jgi:hypothetical protein
MFWNDPILYGASFPYRELPTPVQTPFAGPAFMPWQNVPRLVPPFYGFQTPYNLVSPHLQMAAFNPYLQTYGYQIPQVPQFPQFSQIPQFPQFPQFNVPQMNWIRPFGC